MKVLVYNHIAEHYLRMLNEQFPEIEVAAGKERPVFYKHIGDADVLLAWKFPLDGLSQARKLRWIQLTSAGVDHLCPAADSLRDVVITNARGIHADVMADFAIGAITMLHWNFLRLLREQQARQWNHRFTEPLASKTVGVVGLGAIGQAIARRAAGAGMTVLGARRTPEPVEGVSRVFGPDHLRDMLALCDFVVLVVPQTPETDRMIGEAELRAMRRTAHLINIARGSVVDEPALIRALQERWIAGAALDVFAKEPLPADSPFWTMEHVIITPHVAGEPVNYAGRVMEIFAENLKRWAQGQPLRNVIDLSRGY